MFGKSSIPEKTENEKDFEDILKVYRNSLRNLDRRLEDKNNERRKGIMSNDKLFSILNLVKDETNPYKLV